MEFYPKCFIDHPITADLSKSQPVPLEPKARGSKCIAQLDNTVGTLTNSPL